LVFGVIAFVTEMVNDTGFFAGVAMFTAVYVFMDWQAYVIIITFFFITGIAINIENRYKSNRGEFELYKAKRPIGRVLGRSLAGTIFAGLFFLTDSQAFKLAFMASYAAAIADTVATKLGKYLSKKPVFIMDLKTVPHGTGGAISLQGTLCGIVAAFLISVVGLLTGLINLHELFIVLIAAFIGMIVDSFLNAVSYQKRYIPNEFINFFSSTFAGLICIWIQWTLNLAFGM